MRFRQVGDVDVVPNAGAVPSRIISAVNVQMVPHTRRCLQRARNQVGFGIMKLADFATLVGARRIEIA